MTTTPERSPRPRRLARGLMGSLVLLWGLSSPAAAQGISADVGGLLDALAIQAPSRAASAPAFSLAGLDGAQVRLADLKRRALLLYFWTTW